MQNIFLTGAGGFLGGILLENLLVEPDTKIFLLLRKNGLSASLNKHTEKGNLQVLYGDLSQEYFALPVHKYKELSHLVDITIHCAGKTDHFGSLDDFLKHNVQCTENICDFVRQASAKVLHFISTSSVGYEYALEGQKLEEKFYSEFKECPTNYYTYSKALAEKHIKSQLSFIRAHVYRIGNIPFTRKLRHLPKLPLKNAFIKTLHSFVKVGYAPDNDQLMFHLHYACDVAHALLKIILHAPNKAHVYNFINPNTPPLTPRKIKDILSDSPYAIDLMPTEDFRTFLEERGKHKEHLMEVAHLMTYLYSTRTQNKEYETVSQLALQHLEEIGCSWDPSVSFDFVQLMREVRNYNG